MDWRVFIPRRFTTNLFGKVESLCGTFISSAANKTLMWGQTTTLVLMGGVQFKITVGKVECRCNLQKLANCKWAALCSPCTSTFKAAPHYDKCVETETTAWMWHLFEFKSWTKNSNLICNCQNICCLDMHLTYVYMHLMRRTPSSSSDSNDASTLCCSFPFILTFQDYLWWMRLSFKLDWCSWLTLSLWALCRTENNVQPDLFLTSEINCFDSSWPKMHMYNWWVRFTCWNPPPKNELSISPRTSMFNTNI